MSESFQTPFPTDSSRSQAFALKTTRPCDTVPGSHSPVPRSSKPTVKRVYARKKSLHGNSSSRNLKENSFYSKSGSGTKELKLNLRSKLRARRTTSFASLQDRKKENEIHSGPRLGRKSSRASSRRSLDSPFCSQPSSPNKGEPAPGAQVSRSNSKRNRSSGSESGDPTLPVPKRRNSTNISETDFAIALLPSPSRSPLPAGAAAQGELNRRPSHPDLGYDSIFGPEDGLDFLQASLPPIDFNRPPSQLSIYAPMGLSGQTYRPRADSLISNDRFAADVLAASTPYASNRVSFGAQIPAELQASCVLEPSPTLLKRDALDSLTENMSLTSVVEPSFLNYELSADRTPWITDSLISPPTIYRRQNLGSEPDDSQDSPTGLAGATNILGLDTARSPGPGSDNAQTKGGDANAHKQEHVGQDPGAQGSKATNVPQPREAAGRVRSGPVIASAPVAAPVLVGRSRTGTITAVPVPLVQNQTRQRSGTVTPNSAPKRPLDSEPALPVAGRSRSGTITATRPKSGSSASSLGMAADEAFAKETAVEPHVDADYDPTPADEMQFSSAPNPDIDPELDDDMGDVTFCSSHIPHVRSSGVAPPANKASRKSKLALSSSATEPGTAEAKATLGDADSAAATKGESGSGGRKAGSDDNSKRSKRINLKAALGLNPKSAARQPKDSTFAQGPSSGSSRLKQSEHGPLTAPSSYEDATLSSDPLDLLSHFDENDFNKPFEGSIKKSGRGRKGRGRSAKASQ